MPETPSNTTSQSNIPSSDDIHLRSTLARTIIAFVFGGIGVIGVCAITMAAAPSIIMTWKTVQLGGDTTAVASNIRESFASIKDILGILLPVLSAWAGTVLAFYFTRDNFESAARSTANLVRQLTPEEKLKSTQLKDVMIRIEDADTLILTKTEKDTRIKPDMIDGILEKKKRNRLPILDPGGLIKYMAHRSLIDKFIAEKASGEQKVDELTLDHMLSDKEYKEVLTGSYKTLQETSSLVEAKTLMDKITICSDVFVTEDGQPTSRVIGWITDVIVREQSTL